MYIYSWFIVLTESLLTVRLAVSEIKPVQSLTDIRTDRIVNYSNSRCACARGLIMRLRTIIISSIEEVSVPQLPQLSPAHCTCRKDVDPVLVVFFYIFVVAY